MLALLYILMIAIVNLTIGFAVATVLQRRAHGQMPLDDPFAPPAVPLRSPPQVKTPPAPSPDAATSGPTTDSPPPSSEAPARQPAAVEEEDRQPPQPPDSENDASVERFRDHVHQYHDLLSDLDEQLRQFNESAQKEEVSSCLDSLKQANEEYLESQDRLCQTFQQLHKERQEYQQVCNNLDMVVERQTQQINATHRTIESFDFEGDLLQGCHQLSEETGKLLGVNHQLRDTLDDAFVTVVQGENRLDQLGAARLNDELTGLANRAGLEAALADWWQKDPQRARQLTAAMIDTDQFDRFNQQRGPKLGDRVLHALAQLVATESSDHLIAARYSGQQFVLLFGDLDVRFTTNVIERIRQLIEHACFRHGREEFKVTVSCAVVEANADDTSTSLHARMESTIREAKRYGRNRTFLHEGKYPTPVVPPNFTLEERSITV
jgi:diguanylate cyclase (GGDEF)-like protein